MTDLSAAYQEVKSLPDDILSKELSQPSGSLPGYIVMAELQDRQAIRGSTQSNRRPLSMKDELLSRQPAAPMNSPVRQYAQGGIVAQTNPFFKQMLGMQNPEVGNAMSAQQMMDAAGGFLTPQPLQAPSGLTAPVGIASLIPSAPTSPEQPKHLSGLGSLR